MGDGMMELEERLSQLVPRGISDEGQARMEGAIDSLASEVEVVSPTGSRWRRTGACGVAACALGALGLFLWSPSEVEPVQVVQVVAEAFPAIEYLASQVQVTELTDDGWGSEDGAEQPHRYWISMVTETEDLLDRESGYQVKVVSEREMVVPVLLTHL
jgi:hypothetical protein